MDQRVTAGTQGNEIFFTVFARMASKHVMMNFKVLPRSAELTTPTVAPEHALTQHVVLTPF
jgi:hypothetical protein